MEEREKSGWKGRECSHLQGTISRALINPAIDGGSGSPAKVELDLASATRPSARLEFCESRGWRRAPGRSDGARGGGGGGLGENRTSRRRDDDSPERRRSVDGASTERSCTFLSRRFFTCGFI